MERLLKAPGKKRGILGHIRGVGRPHITVVRRTSSISCRREQHVDIMMAGRRAGSDVSPRGCRTVKPRSTFEVLRPEATELDVRSQQVHADDLCIAENYLDLEGAQALTSAHIQDA